MDQVNEIYRLMRMIERVYRCRVCIVDGVGNFLFSMNFPEIDTTHLSPNCNSFRHQGHNQSLCRMCDEFTASQHYSQVKKSFYKICPAGFMEVVGTVAIPGYKMFHVYAGIFKPRKDMPPDSLIVKNRLAFKGPEKLHELTDEEFEELPVMMSLLTKEITELFQKQLFENKQYPLTPQVMIRSFINRQFRQNISLSDLAKYLGWTPSHTTVRVREYFGKTFTELLNIRRIENAKWLLSNEFPAPLTGIAAVSGFRSPSYFHKVFYKVTGMRPLEYRKYLQETGKVGQEMPPADI